ncbi:MAG: hypothetical protein ACXITV_08400 [Luteibaculaceae bacterium]
MGIIDRDKTNKIFCLLGKPFLSGYPLGTLKAVRIGCSVGARRFSFTVFKKKFCAVRSINFLLT